MLTIFFLCTSIALALHLAYSLHYFCLIKKIIKQTLFFRKVLALQKNGEGSTESSHIPCYPVSLYG